MDRVVVAGASGFLGRVLCERLREEGASVRAFMRHRGEGPWDEVVVADLGAEDELPGLLRDVGTVFHLASAAASPDDAAAHRRVTVEGTRRLLDAAARAAVERFVFFSSVKAMGESGPACLDENSIEAPCSAYGRAKLEAERLVAEAGRPHGLHTVTLRLPAVYGPGSTGSVARMLAAVAGGRFPPLPDSGNRRSLVHVADAVEAALLAVRTEVARGRTYIVTDGHPYSTREMYLMMCEALGRRPPRWAVPVAVFEGVAALGDGIGWVRGRRSGFDSEALRKLIGSAWYDDARIRRELGYRPRHTLRTALPEMVAAYRRDVLPQGRCRLRGSLLR